MDSVKRLLVFDLKGSLGHFRKFYTNSSSLTYTCPPRTTATGLIAGILGIARDSYYETFSTNNCKIAISIRRPIKKIMQTVNYLRTKDSDGYSTSGGVINHFIQRKISTYPTPLELIIPENPKNEIAYRFYFSHKDERVMEKLAERIQKGLYVYPPYLGLSEFLGEVDFVATINKEQVTSIPSNTTADIITACNADLIEALDYENGPTIFQYIEEKMPIEFGKGRVIRKKGRIIHEQKGLPIRAKLKDNCFKIHYNEPEPVTEYISFLE